MMFNWYGLPTTQQHLQHNVYGDGSGFHKQHGGNQQQYHRNQQQHHRNQQLRGVSQQPNILMWQAMQPQYGYGGNRSGIHKQQYGRSQQHHGGNRQQPDGNQQHGGNQQQPGRNQQQHCGMGGKQKEEFEFFFGPKFTFSQMHPAKFTVDGIQFCCMEQYMQYQKAMTFGDGKTANQIMSTQDPKEHKKLGRKVSPFNPTEWGWKSVAVVKKGNIHKYLQNPSMKAILFATYPKTLVEASPRDRLWGIGMGKDNPNARDRSKWRGRNLLGQTLTEVRDHLMTQGPIRSQSSSIKEGHEAKKEYTSCKHKAQLGDKNSSPAKIKDFNYSKDDFRKTNYDKHCQDKKDKDVSKKSDEHKHSKKSDKHKHSKKSDEHKQNKKSDEHSSADQFDTNKSGRKDEQISSGSKIRGETTHQNERSGDGKSSSSKKSSDKRHQSDEERSSSKKRKHEDSKDGSRSDKRHQSDEESSSSKKRKHEDSKDGSRSDRRHQYENDIRPDSGKQKQKKITVRLSGTEVCDKDERSNRDAVETSQTDAPKQTADYVMEDTK